ncbi:HAD-IA family hydrolase [Amycolatopsis sp. 195334CR]|uniref:HAD-IA family hydrolase n=1 Tax=Amycolatopsis sp. 195334CR TaxID=2814588 RepID=UPI001A8E3499|nr:HAD-IA family hydrolase [Amycolatopsis sp. 195334CR]MBN6034498.1 HAD-IA family hydrolase [Amycolatopsis sp. 195334CR]
MLRGLVLDYAGVLTDPDAAALFEALDLLRDRGVKTALLSNAPGASGPAKRRLAPFFDALVFSGEVGVAKPDERVFLLTADRLGLPPEHCAFVDDSAGNVRGAVAAGMVGVHHTSVNATLLELDALFAEESA